MENLSTKTVCWIDNGLFASFARRIAPFFKTVYYYTPWQNAFPKSRNLVIGEGFGDIKRVKSYLRIKDQVDLWIVCDVFHADVQLDLLSQGRRVWGMRDAEELEIFRWETRKWLQKVGLPVLPAELVLGIDELREHLSRVQHKMVKLAIGRSRGDGETWKHKTFEISKGRLQQLEYDLGPVGEQYPFIIEDIYEPAVEVGYDGAIVDGDYLDPAMTAYEVKGVGMVGVIKGLAEMPEPVRIVNEAQRETLGPNGYGSRGNLATEIRWGRERQPYYIDPCMRLGSPSNELLQELIGNWPEIFWEGAGGLLVKPKVVATHGAVAMVYSETSGQIWEPVFYPPEMDRWVKLRNPLRRGRRNFSVPQGAPQNLAGVVGIGSSVLESIANMAEHARQVTGDRLCVELKSMIDALDVIQNGQKFGIQFSPRPLPSAEELKRVLAQS